MKIKFLVGYPIEAFVTEWSEIRKLSEKIPAPDEKTFILFKALELNQDLDFELKKSRKNLELPEEGLSWEQYEKWEIIPDKLTAFEREKRDNFYRYYPKEIDRILRKMHLHLQVQEQLHNLILGNFVEPDYRGIGYGYSGTNADEYESMDDFDDNTEIDTVSIMMTKKVSKNELIRFINKSWSDIDKLLGFLTEIGSVYISPRDLRIVELRDSQKLKYNQIAEQIVEEFSIDDINGTINEDSIKTSYKRAKDKIQNLAKPLKK